MNSTKTISTLLTITLVVIFCLISRVISSVLLFIPGLILSYFLTTSRYSDKSPDPAHILPLYLLLVGIQMLHFSEEYLTDLNIALPKLIGRTPYPLDFWVSFNMVAYFIFILGGIILYKRWTAFFVIPFFFLIVGVVFNGIIHVLISIYVWDYFPGLYTALIYLLFIPAVIRNLIKW